MFLVLHVNLSDDLVANFGGQIKLEFCCDDISRLMLLSIALVVFSAGFVGQYTIKENYDKDNFFLMLLIALLGMNGVVVAADLFTLYVFVEITSIVTFVLIALYKDIWGLEGAFKYIIVNAVASAMMLAGIAIIMMITGELAFSNVKNFLMAGEKSLAVTLSFAFFTIGFFIKGGVVPFHWWVPDVYTAPPAAVSVLLGGIVTKVTGVYALIRLLESVVVACPSLNPLLLVFGAVSVVIGALAALGQKDFKRMLAYSSVSQIGYIFLGLGIGTDLGKAGALFHFFNHSVFKSLLFANSAAVEKQTGLRDMDNLSGIGNRMPVTAATSLVASLSTAGLPPLSGFWSKLVILLALWKEESYLLAAVGALASLLTLAYFLMLQRKLFFGKPNWRFENTEEVEFGLLIPVIFLSVLTIGLGILFPKVVGTILLPVETIL